MDLRKFYQNNEWLIKNGAKGAGYVFSALIVGFFAFLVKHRKQLVSGEDVDKPQNEVNVSLEKLEKIVNKIKNGLVHNLAVMFDLSHVYDPEEFQNKGEDIQVDEVKVEEEKPSEGNEFYRTNSMMSENLNANSPNTSNLKKSQSQVDTFNREFKPLVDKPKFRDEKLLNFEIGKIKQFELEPEDYYTALKKNMHIPSIKKNMEIIRNFKRHFDRDELMKIDFGEAIGKNYIKIITNIYYLNLRKTQKKFKDDFVDKGYDFRDSNETAKAFSDIYRSFLKETRKEVLNFFKVQESDVISPKVMLRIYPYYFSPYHPLRIKYEEINKEVDMLIKKIRFLGSIDELYNDTNPEAILKPVDKIIDFKHLLSQKSSGAVGEESKPEKDRNKRILSKFDEVYQGKRADDEDEVDEEDLD